MIWWLCCVLLPILISTCRRWWLRSVWLPRRGLSCLQPSRSTSTGTVLDVPPGSSASSSTSCSLTQRSLPTAAVWARRLETTLLRPLTHTGWELLEVSSHLLTKSGHYHRWPQILTKSGHYHRWPLTYSQRVGIITGDLSYSQRVGIITGDLSLTHKEWALSQVTSDTHKEWALSQVTSHVLTKSGHYHWWPQLLSKSGHYHRWPLTYSQIVGIITGDPSLTHKRWVLFWVIIGEHWLSYSPVIIVHPLSVPSETRDRFALWAYMRKCQYLALNLCCGSGDHVKWQSSHLRKGDVKEHMKLTCTLAVTTFITPYNAI